MGRLKRILPYQFRNLVHQPIECDSPAVILTGENGQGKTNFLEAVYLLSYGSSFRTHRESLLFQDNTARLSLIGEFDSETLPVKVSVKMEEGRKEIFLNDKHILDRKEMMAHQPSLVYTHDDIALLGGPPDARRRFLDQTLSLLDPAYIDLLRDYKKTLKQRNVLLKQSRTDLLETYSFLLAEKGAQLMAKRRKVLAFFDEVFTSEFSYFYPEEEINLSYAPSWKEGGGTNDFFELLMDKLIRDKETGSTQSGPHRDDFRILSSKKDYIPKASTGQKRLSSLILKNAQARLFFNQTKRRPLLLLDDVLLELDHINREKFLSHVPENSQIFFTLLPGSRVDFFPFMEQYLELKAEKGQIIPV